MSTVHGYMAGSLTSNVSSFFKSLREAREEAAKMEKGFVCTAHKVYERNGELGLYHPYLLDEIKTDTVLFTVPFGKVGDRDVFELDGIDISKDSFEVDNLPHRKAVVKQLAKHPATEYAFPDQGTVKLLRCRRTRNEIGWGFFFKRDLHMSLASGGKAIKRGTQALRKYISVVRYAAGEIEFAVTDDPSLTKRLDGGIILPWKVHQALLEKMPKEMRETLKGVLVYNIRIYVPAGVLEQLPNGGMVKGQGFVSRTQDCIIFHGTNCKKEVRVSGGKIKICMVPQEGKMRARDNDHYYIHNPGVFTPEDRMERITKTFNGYRERVESGKLEIDLIDLAECAAKDRIEEGVRYIAVNELLGKALQKIPLNMVPKGLVKEYLLSQGTRIIDKEKTKMQVPLEHTTHCQVISDTLMTLAKSNYLKQQGIKYIPEGGIVYEDEYKVFVVNDEDYENHVMENHGGSDLDDFYDQVFKKVKGEVSVFLFRSPNGWGEWSVWKYCSPYLPFENVGMDDLKDVSKDWEFSTPRSLKKNQRAIKLHEGTKANHEKPYGYDEFAAGVDAMVGGAGMTINMMVMGGLLKWDGKKVKNDNSFEMRPEQVIDLNTQCDNPENLKLLQEFEIGLQKRLEEVARSGRPISGMYAAGRKVLRKEVREKANLVYDDFFSVCAIHGLKERDSWEKWVEEKVEKRFTLPEFPKEVNKKSPLYTRARDFIDLWYKCMRGVEKVNGQVTDVGWGTLAEKRHKFVTNWKRGTLEEMMPYILYQVYSNPSYERRGDEKVMCDPLVLEAYCNYVKSQEKVAEKIMDDDPIMAVTEYEDWKFVIEEGYIPEISVCNL